MTAPAVGVFLPTLPPDRGEPLGDVVAAARHAEAAGLESGWVIDQLATGSGMPILERKSRMGSVAEWSRLMARS